MVKLNASYSGSHTASADASNSGSSNGHYKPVVMLNNKTKSDNIHPVMLTVANTERKTLATSNTIKLLSTMQRTWCCCSNAHSLYKKKTNTFGWLYVLSLLVQQWTDGSQPNFESTQKFIYNIRGLFNSSGLFVYQSVSLSSSFQSLVCSRWLLCSNTCQQILECSNYH